MLGNQRGVTECSEPFPGFNYGDRNINSGFGQILSKRNCSSRTDIQNELYEYPLQGTKRLQHGLINRHLWLMLQTGTPSPRPQSESKNEEFSTRDHFAALSQIYHVPHPQRRPSLSRRSRTLGNRNNALHTPRTALPQALRVHTFLPPAAAQLPCGPSTDPIASGHGGRPFVLPSLAAGHLITTRYFSAWCFCTP